MTLGHDLSCSLARLAQMQMGLEGESGRAQADFIGAEPDPLGLHAGAARQDHDHRLASALQFAALALGGQTRRLAALGRVFGPAMEKTPFAADFRAMTSVETAPRDFAEVMQRVALVDDFQNFIESYRARLTGETAGS